MFILFQVSPEYLMPNPLPCLSLPNFRIISVCPSVLGPVDGSEFYKFDVPF